MIQKVKLTKKHRQFHLPKCKLYYKMFCNVGLKCSERFILTGRASNFGVGKTLFWGDEQKSPIFFKFCQSLKKMANLDHFFPHIFLAPTVVKF